MSRLCSHAFKHPDGSCARCGEPPATAQETNPAPSAEPELDCGDNSCKYAKAKGGMRTNAGCRCDECPFCGSHLGGITRLRHKPWCEWLPRFKHLAAMSGYDIVPAADVPSAEERKVLDDVVRIVAEWLTEDQEEPAMRMDQIETVACVQVAAELARRAAKEAL